MKTGSKLQGKKSDGVLWYAAQWAELSAHHTLFFPYPPVGRKRKEVKGGTHTSRDRRPCFTTVEVGESGQMEEEEEEMPSNGRERERRATVGNFRRNGKRGLASITCTLYVCALNIDCGSRHTNVYVCPYIAVCVLHCLSALWGPPKLLWE